MNIQEELIRNKDEEYAKFTRKLAPTVDPQTIIGVRLPILREIAKKMDQETKYRFLEDLPHKYYEENLLESILLCKEKDYEKCLGIVERFLPYVNNWAVCDTLHPKCIEKNHEKTLERVKNWLASDKVYTIRFGIDVLMTYFLDEYFNKEYLEWVSKVTNDDYYVKMMVAWYYATALAKRWDETIVYLKKPVLEAWTHNKAIQKAIESYRITEKQKEYLRTLKIKKL